MTADPIHFQASMLTDPQRLNLYAYVRDNPLKFIDPAGEDIQLSKDKTKRKEELARWRHLAGKGASYLYVHKVHGNYMLGARQNGSAGKFAGISPITGAMSKLMEDHQQTGKLDLVPAGTIVSDHADQTGGIAKETKIGPVPAETYKLGSQTPGATIKDTQDGIVHWYVQEAGPYGEIPGDMMSDGKLGILDGDIILGHEAAGHGFDDTGVSNQQAVDTKTQVRRAKNPSAPTRTRHDYASLPF